MWVRLRIGKANIWTNSYFLPLHNYYVQKKTVIRNKVFYLHLLFRPLTVSNQSAFSICSDIIAANNVVNSSIKAKSNIYKLDRKEEAPRRKQNWMFRMAALFQSVSLCESVLRVLVWKNTGHESTLELDRSRWPVDAKLVFLPVKCAQGRLWRFCCWIIASGDVIHIFLATDLIFLPTHISSIINHGVKFYDLASHFADDPSDITAICSSLHMNSRLKQ